MAIDPTIALQVRPPQDPIQSLGQIYALKNAGMQQQLNQQQLQQGQMQLQQAGQAQADSQASRAAISANTAVDPTTGMPTLNRAGYLGQLAKTAPGSYLGASQQFTKQDIENQKATAEYTKTKLENQKSMFTLAGQIASTVTDQASWDKAVPQLQSIGALPPGHAPAVYDPQLVQQFTNSSMTAVEHLTAQQKAADAKETARHNTQNETTAAATQAETAKYHGVEAGFRKQEVGIQAGRLGIERQRLTTDQAYTSTAGAGLSGDDFLKTVKPDLQPQVKAAAAGDIKMPPPGSRSPAAQAMRAAVMQYDPTFTDSRYDTKQNFKTKGDAQNIVQLATVMDHADNALTNSKKVGFAPFLSHNATSADTTYNKDVDYLVGEAGKLIKNGVVTVEEVHTATKGLDSSRESIREAALKETLKLVGGKVGGMFQKYKTGTGQDLPVDKFFDKDTQNRLQRLGVVQSQQGGDAGGTGAATHLFNPATGKIEAIK